MAAPLTDGAAFFYANAGYSYPAGATEAEQEDARRECALELAHAERVRRSAGAWIVWEPDPDGADSAGEGEAGPWWQASLFAYGPNGETAVSLASLGGIDSPPGSDYARVVEAELSLEAIGELEPQREAAG